MPSLSSGIQVALQAILSHSQAIEVIEHNVANANTVGYRRQAAVLTTAMPSQIYGADHGVGAGMRGSGVTVDYIQRFNLQFFDDRYRGTTADAKKWDTQQGVMVQMEQTLAETSADGLLPKLDAFWSGWQQVSADPSNTSLRAGLIDEAGALTNAFNRRAEQLIKLRSDQDQAISSRVSEINSLGSQVAALNGEISHVLSIGEQPNDLLDKRDLLLDRLSEVSGATSSEQKNGEVVVSIGGHVLVAGHDSIKLNTAQDTDPASTGYNLTKIVWDDKQGPQDFTAPSGELKGLFEARDKVIKGQLDSLNTMAQAMYTSVNTEHQKGFGLDGKPGLAFFTLSDPSATTATALNIRVNDQLTATNLAVADAPGEAANNKVALAIAGLKSKQLLSGSTETINGFYNSKVTQLGLDIQKAHSSSDQFGNVAKALSTQRESVVGVSLDEEAANMAKSQKAYEAAARMMTVYDDLLDRIINGMGVSGR